MSDVENEFTGANTGYVVQAGTVSGGVHFHQAAPAASPPDRQRLVAALRARTFPVVVGDEPRTAVAVAPGTVATFGTAVEFLEGAGGSHVCLCRTVEPGDELWGFGYPTGDESGASVVGLRCMAVLDEHSGPQPLMRLWGSPGSGSTGGPVLNWRTGAVCGLMLVSASGVWLVPVDVAPDDDRAWLELLDEDQLRASGRRFPGPRLRAYLAEVCRIGDGHPYRPMVSQGPSLTEFYLPQHLRHDTDGTQRIRVDVLADRHEGAHVLGDPGVGKSSLVRHLAAESAHRWLTAGVGSFVPVPVAARALAGPGALPRLLAEGTTLELTTVLDGAELAAMFAHEPMPGVPWLVLVDGLDEVLGDLDRRLVVDRVLGQSTYRFLVTSRPLGSHAFGRLAKRFPTYVVEPFNDEELARFAHAWFDDAGEGDLDVLVGQFMAQVDRSGLDRLARIPLVAMMLCIVFCADRSAGLPRSFYAVYERFFAVLARKLETARERFRARVSAFGPDAEAAVARLVTGLTELLAQVAVARQGVRRGEYPDTRPLLMQAVGRSLPDKPTVVPDGTWTELVAEALRASGLLVQHRDDFRFLHQTVEEYLAARHLADTADRRSILAPRREWPWPHLEVKIFVVALWTTRGVDVTSQLSRLLSRRHRQANAGFVVELARRGVPLPDRVSVLVRAVLAERIHSDKTMAREWLEAVRWLRDLEPERMVRELFHFAQHNAGEDRAVDAVREVTAFDRSRGVALAIQLLNEPATSPGNRFKLAEHLLSVDRASGLQSLVRLLKRADMKRLSLDTTIQAAVRMMLSQDPELATLTVDQIWSPKLAPALRLELARQIAHTNAEAAVWRFAELADDRALPFALRFTAAKELYTLDSTRCGQAMTLLAQTTELPPEARLDAALYLADELSQGIAMLSSLAAERVALSIRLRAAGHVARYDPVAAAPLFLDIAEQSRPGEYSEIIETTSTLDPRVRIPVLLYFVEVRSSASIMDLFNCARQLRELGRTSEIATILERFGRDGRNAESLRMDAAGILAGIDQRRAQETYGAIVYDSRVDSDMRLAAADAVRRFNTHYASALYLMLCAHTTKASVSIAAGRRVGERDGVAAIEALSAFARTPTGRFHLDEIARAMVEIDETEAIISWRRLSRDVGRSRIIDAAERGSRF